MFTSHVLKNIIEHDSEIVWVILEKKNVNVKLKQAAERVIHSDGESI